MQDVRTRHFKVFETYREAWKLVDGAKWPIWGTTLILYIIGISIMIPFILSTAALMSNSPEHPMPFLMKGPYWLDVIGLIIGLILIIPGLFAAVGKIALERVRGNTVSVKMGLRSFWHRFIPVTLTLAIAYAIIASPVFLGVLFTHHENASALMAVLFVLYMILLLLVGALFSLSLFFAIDKTLNPFAALIRSATAVYPHYWRVLGLLISSELISFVVQIPMKIGDHFHIHALSLGGLVFFIITMIWIMPWQFLAFGLTYHKLVD